tara:strand:+ start:479 stop:916 length:438 start_codon:yes stop_codon:yes gene_type:complete
MDEDGAKVLSDDPITLADVPLDILRDEIFQFAISQRTDFTCKIQRRIINNIRLFNQLKECNCCEEHSINKPFNIADKGSWKNIICDEVRTCEDYIKNPNICKYPRVLVFKQLRNKGQLFGRCKCNCRHIMRFITTNNITTPLTQS